MSVDRRGAWLWVAGYRGQIGQWAQVFHRLTGLGVAFFLLLHVVDTAVLGWGPEAYNALANFWHQPLFRSLQVVLLGALLFHAVNGVRVILVDFSDWATLHQDQLFWVVVAIFVVLFLPAAYLMIVPVLVRG